MNKLGFAAFLLSFGSFNAWGQAHVHGEGQLLIAQDGKQWQLEFIVPAADLLGFESEAVTSEQKQQVIQLAKQIADVRPIVQMPYNCEVLKMRNSLGETIANEHEHHRHKDKHTHKHDEEHKHDHDHKHDHKHNHDHDHDHKHNDHKHQHSDITIMYQFGCNDEVQSFTVNLFSTAPSLSKLNAQWLTDSGQGAKVLESNSNEIYF